MNPTNQEIRSVLLNRFRIGRKATAVHRYLCNSYGKDVLSERQCHRWFSKFESGNFRLEDKSGKGRKKEMNRDQLKQLIKANPRQTSLELGVVLEVSHITVCNGLQELDLRTKQGTWVPHELNEDQKQQRVNIARFLLEKLEKEPFLDRIVTCDEKWVLYDNEFLNRQWLPIGQAPIPTAKCGSHPKKVLISVFWDIGGIVHYELLPTGQAIDNEVYCDQLDLVQKALIENRPSLINRKRGIFQQDNARPHKSKVTLERIKTELCWEILPHPPYSSDMAPFDYHLFRPMEHFLCNKKFENREALKSGL